MGQGISFVPAGYVRLWDAVNEVCDHFAQDRQVKWTSDIRKREHILHRSGELFRVSKIELLLEQRLEKAFREQLLANSELTKERLEDWRSVLGYTKSGRFAESGSLIVDQSGKVTLGAGAEKHPLAEEILAMRQEAFDAGAVPSKEIKPTQDDIDGLMQTLPGITETLAAIDLRDEVEEETQQLLWSGRTKCWRLVNGALVELPHTFWGADEAWDVITGVAGDDTPEGNHPDVLTKTGGLFNAFENGRRAGSKQTTVTESEARKHIGQLMQQPKTRSQNKDVLEAECFGRFGVKGRPFERAYADAKALPDTHQSWLKRGPARC